MAAEKGLGFRVHYVRFKVVGYQRILCTPSLTPKLSKWGSYRKCHPSMPVIFSDAALLPTLRNYKYWEA